MVTIREAIYEVCEEQQPITCRGLFYQLVSRGTIDKTETEYKSTIVRLTGEMRRSGDLPWRWLADNTRWMRKPRTHDGLEDALMATAHAYRRSLWASADTYVEVWLEKDALASVVYEVTNTYDVPLMVSRGYASLSFLHSAATDITAHRKPTHLYYLGDWDPSGVDIPRKIEATLRELAPKADITFTRLAVNGEQIDELNLPTRPTKKNDTRAKNWTGGSVEVDAIPPAVLRGMVTDAIEAHVDRDELERLEVAEESERDLLYRIAEGVTS